ncbi:MAG: Abi family protein [Prevotellaceae bacterium]|nr:Abi family protein [Prevotellaceae bacterium]
MTSEVETKKVAKTIDEQIALLKSRNVQFRDVEKAKEQLLDIGYFRLGFCFFPFEKSFPQKEKRNHIYNEDTFFENAVALYYFDFDVRQLLQKHLQRIEVSLRTNIIHWVSLEYKDNNLWFVDPQIVEGKFADSFTEKVYKEIRRKSDIIRRHHLNHPNDLFAPPWKTIEFMTFGSLVELYKSLKDTKLKLFISRRFGVNSIKQFISYLDICRELRNRCAHGTQLFHLQLYHFPESNPVHFTKDETHKFFGALKIITFLLGHFSTNRRDELLQNIQNLYKDLIEEAPCLKQILKKCASMDELALQDLVISKQ